MSALGHIRDRVEPIAGQAMCAVPKKRKFPEYQRLREALAAQQDFEPFRSAEACAWGRRPLFIAMPLPSMAAPFARSVVRLR